MNYRVVVVALLLIGSSPVGVAGLETGHAPERSVAEPAAVASDGTAPGTGNAATAPSPIASDSLHRTTVLRHLPERDDAFETEITFRVPDPVTEFEVGLEPEASVAEADGFEPTDGGTYRWTGDDEPTIRFTMPTDRTGYEGHRDGSAATADATRPAGSTEHGYTFVDTGDWGVVRVPSIDLSVRQTEPVGLEETVTVDGPGATGGDVAFFGEVEEYERTVDGETIRLAVSAAADLREEPEDVLESLAAASASLDVGAGHDEVFVVAVPDDVDWAARGVQYGQADAWVVADAPLDDAPSVWLHEFVHTRQPYANPDAGTTSETLWLVEAQAEYYAAALALEQGLIDFREFRSVLERGERSPHAVLADPGTWTGERTPYAKGPLVYGELDRQLRLETDGDRTLEDVFRVLNARDDPVTERAFLEAVEDAGGSDVRSAAQRYTRTAETPAAWNRWDHRNAFDLEAPDVRSGLDGNGLEVAGEPWDHPSERGDDGPPVAVPVGEPVTVPVALENVDDRDGTADAVLSVDGGIVDLRQRGLEAGERTTAPLAWTPSRPGEYDVRAGDDRFTVLVRPPSSVEVVDLAVEPERVDPGDPVTATATVTAADSRPGAAVLEFRTGDGVVERPVAVAPGKRTTVDATLTFADAGRHEVAVGERSATVTVGDALARLESIPGFVAAVGGALVVAALLSVRRG